MFVPGTAGHFGPCVGNPEKDIPQTEYDFLMAQHIFDVHKVESKMYKYMRMRQSILGSFSICNSDPKIWLSRKNVTVQKVSKDYVEGTEKYKSYANEVASSNNQAGFRINAFNSPFA